MLQCKILESSGSEDNISCVTRTRREGGWVGRSLRGIGRVASLLRHVDRFCMSRLAPKSRAGHWGGAYRHRIGKSYPPTPPCFRARLGRSYDGFCPRTEQPTVPVGLFGGCPEAAGGPSDCPARVRSNIHTRRLRAQAQLIGDTRFYQAAYCRPERSRTSIRKWKPPKEH